MSTEKKTVRELAGEIWAAINGTHWQHGDELDPAILNEFIDVVLGVLARHEGSVIVNDADLPVVPLSKANK